MTVSRIRDPAPEKGNGKLWQCVPSHGGAKPRQPPWREHALGAVNERLAQMQEPCPAQTPPPLPASCAAAGFAALAWSSAHSSAVNHSDRLCELIMHGTWKSQKTVVACA